MEQAATTAVFHYCEAMLEANLRDELATIATIDAVNYLLVDNSLMACEPFRKE
jgi:hypothetical protein